MLQRDSVSVFLVNRSLSEDVDVQVSFGDRRAKPNLKTTVLTGVDPKAHNTWEEPDVIGPVSGISTVDANGTGTCGGSVAWAYNYSSAA